MKNYTVTQVNAYIEGLFSDDSLLGDLSIEGEVSNCKYNTTGHIYFTLKDDRATLSCVMFAGKRKAGLRFPMKDGDKVVASGYVGVYTPAGRYQLYADSIVLSGVGNLYQRFEALKKRLADEGLFDKSHKKSLPAYAMTVGVVTAATGAAVRDIIRVSKSRNPYVQILLCPSQVQGEGAAESIAAAIDVLDRMGLDVIIVGRGGGSIEDLWAFNEEVVARAIFRADTPVVSAVGHETDYTIADFVADLRAATPSQAAELVNFVYDDFARQLDRYADKLHRSVDFALQQASDRVLNYRQRLFALRPDNRLAAKQERLANLYHRLVMTMNAVVDRYESLIKTLSAHLDGLSPAKRLAAGFGYLSDGAGKRVDSATQLAAGDSLRVRLRDGVVWSRVETVEKKLN